MIHKDQTNFILVVVVIAVLFSSLQFQPLAAASQKVEQEPVAVDGTLFSSTVPSSMVLGQNYSVSVRITNNGLTAIPLIVSINAPADYIIAHPLNVGTIIGAGNSAITNFFIIGYQEHAGSLNVTVSVWLANNTQNGNPLFLKSVSALVFTISKPILPSSVLITVTVGLIGLGAAYFVRRRLRPNPTH